MPAADPPTAAPRDEPWADTVFASETRHFTQTQLVYVRAGLLGNAYDRFDPRDEPVWSIQFLSRLDGAPWDESNPNGVVVDEIDELDERDRRPGDPKRIRVGTDDAAARALLQHLADQHEQRTAEFARNRTLVRELLARPEPTPAAAPDQNRADS